MEAEDWHGGTAVGMYLNGNGIPGRDAQGRPITDDHFLLYFNGGDEVQVVLPPSEYADVWHVVVDTGGERTDDSVKAGETVHLVSHGTLVLQQQQHEEEVPGDPSVAASV
jgi:glycogen operon protein